MIDLNRTTRGPDRTACKHTLFTATGGGWPLRVYDTWPPPAPTDSPVPAHDELRPTLQPEARPAFVQATVTGRGLILSETHRGVGMGELIQN